MISHIKKGNYGTEDTDTRCLTTTAASAPKGFGSEFQLTLNSAKN